jgi:hypothetical protein
MPEPPRSSSLPPAANRLPSPCPQGEGLGVRAFYSQAFGANRRTQSSGWSTFSSQWSYG